MFESILARLIISQIIEITKNSNLPPLAPNQMPKAEAIDIITPVMK